MVVFWSLFPIIWNFLTSLKSRRLLFQRPPAFIFEPDFSAYSRMLADARRVFWPALTNSAVISFGVTIGVVVVASLAAYAFSRFELFWSSTLYSGFLATRLLPPIVAVLPLYSLGSELGLIDTRLILIVIYMALLVPLAIWLLRQYFDAIPIEIEEAAQTDGASRLQTLWKITLPLAAPGIVAVGLLMFAEAWNEFMFAVMFTDIHARTLPVVLSEGRAELLTDFQGIAAMATVQMLPVFVIAIVANRYLISGLTAGAVK